MLILRGKSDDLLGLIRMEQTYTDDEIIDKAWDYCNELEDNNWKIKWTYYPGIAPEKYFERIIEWSQKYGKV